MTELLGLVLLALSSCLYILYQELEVFAVGLSSVALFAVGSYILVSELRFLKPFARILPFIVVGAAVSLAIIALNLQAYIDSSAYSAFLALMAARFAAFLMVASGVNVHVSNDVLSFPNGTALSVGPLCGGAYSTILFFLLSLLMVADYGRSAPGRRLATAVALGFVGANLANVFRITFLAWVMYLFGVNTLEIVHQFAGYAVFLGFMSLFWWASLKWLNGGGHVSRLRV